MSNKDIVTQLRSLAGAMGTPYKRFDMAAIFVAADLIEKQDAVLDRLGERKYMYQPNEVRMRSEEPNWKAECEARIEYAKNRGEQT
jgi:hypothetical protein